MDSEKNIFKPSAQYLISLIKWIAISVVVGIIGGGLGGVFHIAIDYVTHIRTQNNHIVLLLPLGGIIITALYGIFKKSGRLDTNRVIEAARDDEKVPLTMAPAIFISTCITHLLGGSAGREGAALQLGGSIGYNIGKVFRISKKDMHFVVKSGMSAVFAALFGTPLTAAFFSLEVTRVGVIHYAGLVPCVISSVTAYKVAAFMGLSPVRFDSVVADALSTPLIIKAIILAILCAMVSIIFCASIKKCEHLMDKTNKYLRTVIGALLIVGLTYATGTFDYNGAGMDVITRALEGNARYESFLLKIIFTAITISAGFKGGEIVPTFFIGSTFGCVAGGLLGIDPGFGAAIGFVALFCSVVNCPVASIMLALEVFGADSIIIMAIVCAVSFMMSGRFGLYKSQKIVYSKINEDKIDVYTR